jgi:hypothetical protein
VLVISLLVCEATQSALASTITIGETNVLSAADSGNADLLAAQNATLSQPATIESLSLYVTQASGNLVLGIYDASGPNGGPGALKAQTNSFTPIVGWNTANVTAPVLLPAGTYWLAYLPSSNSLAFMKGQTSGVSIRYYSYAFGTLPATFSTSPSSDAYHWSFYATLNPAPTISSVSLSNSTFTAGVPSGTVVGAINVAMSSGSFTGSLSLSGANAPSFKIVGSNLETNAVLPPGPYNINIVATQSGAANSPFTQAETIIAVSQSISSVSLSNGSFAGGSPSGTIVGAINVKMSPSSPAFSGSVSLSTTKRGCTATNGANNSSFAISGNKLITNGTVAPGTYAVCILATEASASNSPVGQAEKLTANSTNITIGETNQLAGGVIGDANLLFAQNAVLSQTATIESLSIYAAAGTGNLILGIYADNGSGAPGALQAQTASFSAAAGWNTANVTAPVSLKPGTYWLAWLTDGNALSVPGVTTGTDAYYPFSFGSLPPTFSGTATIEAAHRSLYATLNTAAVSQSISSVALSNSSVVGGSPSGTVVGTINVAMSPSSPAFSGSLSLSTTQGGCTATNGANNSSFAITGNNLVTNRTVAPGSYAVCTLATQAGATNSPFGQASTITASSQSTASLSASPTTITSGQSSTLTWSSTGATSCTGTNFFTGSGSPKSGSTTVSPAQTTTYTVACTNGTNSASASATVTVPGIQTISSIALSNNNTTTGLSFGTPLGTLSAIMNPVTPAFSYTGTNLHLSTTGTDSGGACNSTNGAGNGSFQIINGDTLATNGTLTSGSMSICVAASEAGLSAKGQAFTINVGNRIDAAATYCSANGGGDGSSGNPWQAACIQAAINAAANGDTVFLAAGNWALNVANAGIVIGTKSINLVGAGSGNTFDYLGHPNNGSGGPVGTNTRVYTVGTLCSPGPCTNGGYIVAGNYDQLGSGTGCAGGNPVMTASHIYFDGSIQQSRRWYSSTSWEDGDYNGTFNVQSCPNATVNDIRYLGFNAPNAQFFVRDSNNFTLLNSVDAMPASGGRYAGGESIQYQEFHGGLIKNNIFYGQTANNIDVDSMTYTANYTFYGCDNIACTSSLAGYGSAGCGLGFCYAGGGTSEPDGSHHFFNTNNYFSMSNNGTAGTGSSDTALGGGVNDPTTNGILNDLEYTGNWLVGQNAYLSSCVWRGLFGTSCGPSGTSGSPGMQINSPVFANNTVLGSVSANIDFRGNGCPDPASTDNVGTGPADCGPGNTLNDMQCVNCTATKTYLQAPTTQYLIDSNSVNASQTSTYCSGSSFSGCSTTGFTAAPTASFTLGSPSGSVVPFNTTTFTAQYGAVKWLASTSSTTPTSTGQAGTGATWSFLPPITLTATHGNTVYMWVMDSANHISSAASQVVP